MTGAHRTADRTGRADRAANGADSPGRSGSSGRTDADSEAVDSVLTALADPTRRLLLDLLAAQGEATATTLAERLPVSRQAVVKHLGVLDGAGLVSANRVGREVRYAVRSAALDATARWMAALASEWDRRLANIKRIAEAAERDAH
ncbi:transcriptional regulator [Streptomyces armeniacus]|uniref:Transcriptional regulator n=1 Tax=Streptomyces armeniacus TaxID=83291 RepID=A0A345Y0X8_9ACTN|nr:transcriptional regulator [Streptomyces armeniacus]